VNGSSLTQTGGTLLASGTNSVLELYNGTTVTGGTLTATNGGALATVSGYTVTLSNLTISAGSTYTGQNNSVTYLNGTIDNAGTLAIAGTNNGTELRVEGGQTLTLMGGGTVSLAGTGNNLIRDANLSSGELVNVNNTIEGGGNIGDGQMALDNQAGGTIDATSASGLTLDPDGVGYTNEGLIEATGGGLLTLEGSSLTQTGGTLLASGTGSIVQLNNNVSVTGGTLTTTGGGSIYTQNNANASLANLTISTGSTYIAQNNTNTFLSGTINNQGTIALDAVNNNTDLRFADGLTLTGGGTIALNDNSNNLVFGSLNGGQETVTNVNNTVEGSGLFGYSNSFEFINKKGGVIDATGTAAALMIAPTTNSTLVAANSGGFVNLGLLEATNTAGLVLMNGQFDNATGTILAAGAGDDVYLQNAVTITGGLLLSTNGGEVQTENGTNAFLDGTSQGAITLAGTEVTVNNSSTWLNGTVDNTGDIQIDAANNNADLRFADGTTLTGGGTISLNDNSGNLVFGALNNGQETVTNVNNTVEGSGLFGYSNAFEFINQKGGVIDATGTAAALTIAPTTNSTLVAANSGGFVNLGLLEATNTAGLVLMNGQFGNATGTILAAGAGDNVYLQNTVTITGGLLLSTNGGEVQTESGTNAFLDGTSQGAITLAGTEVTVNNSVTWLNGTIDNTGQIQANATNNNAQLRFADGTTLTGGGTITLDDNTGNLVWGAANSGQETVTNVNNRIQGSGQFGNSNAFEFINQKGGVIDATGTAAALTIAPTTNGSVVTPNGGGFVNLGLLEATNTAGLILSGGQFNNAAGTILAAGAGDNIYLRNNATVSGGLLEGVNGGEVQTESTGETVFLDGASQGAITLAGTFITSNNSVIQLDGTIDNTGEIQINSTNNNAQLRFADGTTLTGDGTITLDDDAGNLVWGAANSGAEVLTNANNLIQGSSQFGFSNSFGIVNGGTFSATGPDAFDLNPSINNSLTAGIVNLASGVLQGVGTGGLVITQSSVNNQGTVQALDDSSVTYNANVTNQNASSGTLTGGTWAAIVTTPGDTAVLQATGGTIDTDAAHIIMSGSGASVRFYNGSTYVDIQNSLTSVTAGGELDVLAGANFSAGTATQAIANSGLVVLGGGTFTDATFNNTGTLRGFGTLTNSDPALTNSGLVVAIGGDLVLAQGVTGLTGDVTIAAGASLDVSGAIGGNSVGTLLHDGLNLVLGAEDITVADDYNNANFGVGNSFDKHANVTGTGSILAAGTVAQILTGNVTSGTSAAPLMAFGNIHVGDTVALNYGIANTGSGGPVLRGAIQTSAGGASLTDTRLTGTGVTASDFGPLAQGATTSAYGVTFTGSSAGSLVAQSVHVANNFDNVAEQTLTITGAAYRYADPSAVAPNPVVFGNRHLNDVVSQGLTLTNTDPNDGFSEALDASIGGATGDISAAGTFTGLTASLTNAGSLAVTLNTGTVGIKSGQAVISLISDGNNIDGLGTTAIGTQTVTVTGTVYRLAAASTVAPNPVVLGNHHVNDVVSQSVTLTNTDPNDGFSEALDASIGSATGSISAAGSFTGLTAGLSNTGSLAVTLNTGTAGNKSGQAVISLISDGNGIDGLGTTAIGSQTVTVTGAVYRLAAASPYSPQPINLGNSHVNDSVTQALTITNTAVADGFSEALDAGIGSATGAISAAGSFTALAAGLSNNGSLSVALNTGTAGIRSGQAVISLISDGNSIDGLGTTSIGTQTVAVTGTVYRLAAASPYSPAPVNLGNSHVNDSVSQGLTLTNTATADGFSEALDASIGGASGNISAAGSFTALASGLTNAGSLSVALNTGTAGVRSGQAVITLTSDGNNIDGLGTTAIGTQTVTVTGDVYRLAAASPYSPAPVNLGNSHVNDSVVQGLTLTNTATADGFSEALDAGIGSATGAISAAGSFSALAAGLTNSGSQAVTLNTGSDGAKSGQAVISLISDGNNIDGLGTTAIGTQTVAVTGTVYAYAAPVISGTTLDFGATRTGQAALTQSTTITNGTSADPFQEALAFTDGAAPTGFAVTSNGTGTIASGGNVVTGLSLATGTSGDFTGAIVVGLTSKAGGAGLTDTVLTSGTVTVSGKVYATAVAQLSTETLNFGVVHVGDQNLSQVLSITNVATGALTDSLIGQFGSVSGPFTGSGSLSAVAANASGTLSVGLNTTNAGSFSASAPLNLSSHDADQADVGVSAGPVTVTATINNYATAVIDDLGGAGNLGQVNSNYTLNFGTVAENSGTDVTGLAVMNDVSGPADLLTGQFGGITGSGFGLSGFGAIGTLSAGQSDSGLTVSFDTSVEGQFTETVTLMATGTNSSGFSGALTPDILTITGTVACFASGTRLATLEGEVAVEDLAVGDELRTTLGGSGEIVWIGTRTVDCARHPEPETVWPIRVAAGAFGTGAPRRTLYLSPDHAVYVDGVLVPVKLLMNGTTVRQIKRRLVTYYHVELPRHDVILAEGLTVESYLELGDRANFEGGKTMRLFPDFAARLAPNTVLAWETRGAAPLVMTGPGLVAARAVVAAHSPRRRSRGARVA
jgi:Hint domain